MARKLRIEYPGALHHVINRGNYRRDLFESDGAAEAFVRTLFEAAGKFGWRVHAYVLMRNHFHLALETPQPTLGEGMHWLQGTMANRFNRLRKESGHLFQGRYKSLILQDFAALARVVDYIHLNPVRARVVRPDALAQYRWSTLHTLGQTARPVEFTAADWLHARGGWKDDQPGIDAYVSYLQTIAADEAAWEREGLTGLSAGWAIGTYAWRRTLAKECAQTALSGGLSRNERTDMRRDAWEAALRDHLARIGRTPEELCTKPRKQDWKIALAERLRNQAGASITWLAQKLDLGEPATLRGYLHQASRAKNT